MQRHIIVQIIRKRVRNLANYTSLYLHSFGQEPTAAAAAAGSTWLAKWVTREILLATLLHLEPRAANWDFAGVANFLEWTSSIWISPRHSFLTRLPENMLLLIFGKRKLQLIYLGVAVLKVPKMSKWVTKKPFSLHLIHLCPIKYNYEKLERVHQNLEFVDQKSISFNLELPLSCFSVSEKWSIFHPAHSLVA